MKKFTVSVLFFALGCAQEQSASNLDGVVTASPPATTSSNACTSPTHSTIYLGERSSATTVSLRGAHSDIKINNDTGYPATLYTDAGALGLKYSYWNGTRWVVEPVAGGAATEFTFVRTAFLSNGRPIAVWSNGGTTLRMSARSAALTSESATWSSPVAIDSYTAGVLRSVEVSVNPNGEVLISYVTHATTNPRARILYCSSNCHEGGSYAAMSSAQSITGANIGNNNHSMGAAWCYTGSDYYPAVAFGGTANSHVAICRQADLANCLTSAGWSTTTFPAGASRVTNKLYLDPAVANDTVKLISQDGTTMKAYLAAWAGGGCATGTVAALGAGTTISASGNSAANAFATLMKDSTGKFHIVANEAATAVRYYNTSTTMFTTGWNAAHGVISSLAIGAAGSATGGAVLDSTTGSIYATYGRTAAATPHAGNHMIGWVDDYTVAANNANAIYGEMPIDSTGQMQLLTGQVPNVSMALTSAGTPAVAFVEYSAAAAANAELKLAIRNGNTASEEWFIRKFPTGVVSNPSNPSLVFDDNNRPWIGYYDTNQRVFKLVTNSQSDGSGTWSQFTYPMMVSVATAPTLPAYHSLALAVDKSVSPSRIVMIVAVTNHGTAAQRRVSSARLNPVTGGWSNRTVIDDNSSAGFGTNTLYGLTADYDSSGNIVAAWYETTVYNRIRYARTSNGGATWSAASIGPVGIGQGIRIAINPANSRPAITFYDRASNRVYYRACAAAIASCGDASNWTTTEIDSSAGVSGLTAAASDGLLSTGLTFTSDGEPFVVYARGALSSGSLMLAKSTSGAFGAAEVLNAGSNGNISGTAAINFGISGFNVDSKRSSVTGSKHSAYIGAGNYLNVTSCGD